MSDSSGHTDTGYDGITRRNVLISAGAAATALGLGGANYLSKGSPGAQSIDEEIVPTSCWIGKQAHVMKARKVGDRVVKLEGHEDDPCTDGTLCPKSQAQLDLLYNPYRVKAPLKRVNEKGNAGEWQELSWDEAKQEIGERVKPKLEDDPRRVVFQAGRKKADHWHDDSFAPAMGAAHDGSTQIFSHSAVCSDAGARVEEMMFTRTKNAEPDLKHTDYLIAWGWSMTNAGGPHLCSITWPQQIVEARERGMKVVLLDPQRRNGGQWVDEWLPIQPGTDLAFWLALSNVLVREGYIDEEYLKVTTNAPCLVDSNGHLARADDADDPAEALGWAEGELVYDAAADEIVPQEEATDPALDGEYSYDGETVKPAFERYRAHIDQYTPEWAAEKTGLDAETIERIALELGEHAKIGATITIDGEELPYRPVSVGHHHVNNMQELGVPAVQAMFQTYMLLGAIEAAGGIRPRKGSITGPDPSNRAGANQMAFNPETIKETPDTLDLGGSQYFPLSSNGFTQQPISLLNPDEYGLEYGPEDMAAFVQMANPIRSAPRTQKVIDAYSKYDTVVVVDPFMSETASLAADYVLPAATLDKYEGPLGSWTGYENTSAIRTQNLMEPMFDSKSDGEIYRELADALDIQETYVEKLNGELGLEDDLAFNDFGSVSVKEGLDRWARSKGKDLEWFEENGVLVDELDVDERYGCLWGGEDDHSPYGFKHYFYSETFHRIGEEVRDRLSTEKYPYLQDYQGFPTWRDPTLWDSPDEFDATLISSKKIEDKQTRTAQSALINEINPASRVRMSRDYAEEHGIEDGDRVTVESHNAMTDETFELSGEAMIVDGLRPDTVIIPAHRGSAYPRSADLDEGANPNWIIPSGPGYIQCTNDSSFQVRVTVEPAGGETA